MRKLSNFSKEPFYLLLIEDTAKFLSITLDRPERMNALNLSLLNKLNEIIEKELENPSHQYLLLRGKGRSFCVGADLLEITNFGILDISKTICFLEELLKCLNNLLEKLQSLTLTIIAILQGYVIGGGLGIALASDYRFITPDVKFRMGPNLLGLIPAGGSTYFIPRLLGYSLARKILLWGEIIDAQEALRIGMADKIIPPHWLYTSSTDLIKLLCSQQVV